VARACRLLSLRPCLGAPGPMPPQFQEDLPMTQLLHLVFGGALSDPQANTFADVSKIDIVGMYPNYASAYDAWKSAAQRTVDDAHMRYFIAHIHRLQDEETEASPTVALR
jgi:hypothetical protein